MGLVILIALGIIAYFVLRGTNFFNTNVSVASSSQSCTTVPVDAGDLSITNQITANTKNSDGTLTITYMYTIRNDSAATVYNLFATSRFNHSTPGLFSIISFSSTGLNLNPNFNGMSDINILANANILPPYAEINIYLTIRLKYSADIHPFINYVTVAGKTDGQVCKAVSSSSSSSSSSRISSSSSSRSSTSSGSTPVPQPGPPISTPQPPASASTSSLNLTTSSSSANASQDLFDSAQVTFDFPVEDIPVITGTGKDS